MISSQVVVRSKRMSLAWGLLFLDYTENNQYANKTNNKEEKPFF